MYLLRHQVALRRDIAEAEALLKEEMPTNIRTGLTLELASLRAMQSAATERPSTFQQLTARRGRTSSLYAVHKNLNYMGVPQRNRAPFPLTCSSLSRGTIRKGTLSQPTV
jgi:hypothetical protein